mmetsp:Transcript_2033/g.7261  ORF Transcript_2033/g.7261 Transcript_2033/m.7261 type:complete len:255 (+) Transcript_2033:802-1566(+)
MRVDNLSSTKIILDAPSLLNVSSNRTNTSAFGSPLTVVLIKSSSGIFTPPISTKIASANRACFVVTIVTFASLLSVQNLNASGTSSYSAFGCNQDLKSVRIQSSRILPNSNTIVFRSNCHFCISFSLNIGQSFKIDSTSYPSRFSRSALAKIVFSYPVSTTGRTARSLSKTSSFFSFARSHSNNSGHNSTPCFHADSEDSPTESQTTPSKSSANNVEVEDAAETSIVCFFFFTDEDEFEDEDDSNEVFPRRRRR